MATTLMNNQQALMGFSNTVSLVDPGYADRVLAMANTDVRTKLTHDESLQQLASTYGLYFHASEDRPYILGGGVAIIPVWGSLLHRDRWCTPWATGYGYIEAALQAALADEEVKGIVWDLNSYGGHVAGNFELCDTITKARSEKPMISIVDSRALSGGYSIATATGRIVATPSADIGSVGVVLMHTSYEKLLDDAGIEVTFVYAGKHKVDGNPYKNLSASVQKRLQVEIDRSYESFVSLVASNRGMDETAVRETEAGVFGADEAKDLGLIDDVMQPRAAFAAFQQELNGSSPSPQKKVSHLMTTKTAENGAGDVTITQAQVDKAASDARAAEQLRVKGITTHAEADGRKDMANHLAFNTSMSVEEAGALLATAPKEHVAAAAPAAPAKDAEGPGAKTGRLAAALEDSANKTVGVDSDDKPEDKPADRTSRLVSAHQKATGRKPTANA